jgi:hypothetical protein
MSIELQFKKGTLALRVVLKDEALAALQKIIAEYQSEDEALPIASQIVQPLVAVSPQIPISPINNDTMSASKNWLSRHSAAEALNLIGWKTNPEKILILAAYHESNGKEGEDWKKTDIEKRFSEAREQFPANFTRDISNAVKDNLVAPATYRTYKVSRTGWNKLAEVIATLANS